MMARTLVLGAALAASAIAGCSLDRTGIGARDAAVDLDAQIDSGVRCLAGSCDDGEPCTDDRCEPSIGCVHEPNTAACNDGVLCNGADACSGGACTVHDMVDPCPGASRCDPSTDSCTGCATAADCPAPITGDYGACSFLSADPCATAGSRTRTVTTYACGGDGMCTPTVTTETDTAGCVRSTDGVPCGAPMTGPWGACGGFADACDESGSASRTVMSPVCSAGTCATVTSTETMACVRETDGMPCGSATCDAWGPCQQSAMGTCTTAGTQARSCRSPVCSGASCNLGATRIETRACTVSIAGLPCTVPPACGPCIEVGRSDCRHGREGRRDCTDGAGMCTPSGGCDPVTTSEVCTCP